jgi:hypothetical protein
VEYALCRAGASLCPSGFSGVKICALPGMFYPDWDTKGKRFPSPPNLLGISFWHFFRPCKKKRAND